MTDKTTVTDMMAAYAQDAVDHAHASSGVALDYSLDSIKGVEEILERLRAVIPRGFWAKLLGKGPSPQDVDQICKMYGGYLGEVIRKAGGGEWTLDTEVVPGQNTICLRKGDRRIWPVDKVRKRLLNGSEDSVWVYGQVVIRDWA
jgi:hypothetical protein